MKWLLLVFSILLIQAPCLFAESIRISQIDTSSLLLNQKIQLYLSITKDDGTPLKDLTGQSLQIQESIDEKQYELKKIKQIQQGINFKQGVQFLLLLDNSGSMYLNDIAGNKVEKPEDSRIFHAKRVLADFIGHVSNPKDRIGLVAYNSFYRKLSDLTGEKAELNQILNQIEKPKPEAAYTELYGSLMLAAKEFRKISGRKAVILLTDGVNEPYYRALGKEHPVFQKQIVTYQKAIKELQQSGVSAFIVHFGTAAHDQFISAIASETGGMFFKAANQEELQNIYHYILNQIINEYFVTYEAGMKPSDKTWVKAELKSASSNYTSSRYYFSGLLMGETRNTFPAWILLFSLAGGVIVIFLRKVKFEHPAALPSIEILEDNGARTSSQTIYLSEDKTFIGSSEDDDLTIAGKGQISSHHAQIDYQPDLDQFTIITDGEVKVNNNSVAKKVLTAGDVIEIDGVTMVFDPGAENETN